MSEHARGSEVLVSPRAGTEAKEGMLKELGPKHPFCAPPVPAWRWTLLLSHNGHLSRIFGGAPSRKL